MGHIAVSKGIANYFEDFTNNRAEVDELLDYDICPRGLVGNDLRKWLLKAWAASEMRINFAVLLEDLYFGAWTPAISKHIPFSSTRRWLENENDRESTIKKNLISDVWMYRTYERQVQLPVFSLRKSTFPYVRSSIMVDVDGFIVLAFAVERAFRVKRLTPAGWTWSETSGYFFPSKVRLQPTRNLDVFALVEAANNAAKAVAEFYVPEHLRQSAA